MKPLAPRNWRLGRAIEDAKKKTLPAGKPKNPFGEKPMRSVWSSKGRRKQRPITLPERA